MHSPVSSYLGCFLLISRVNTGVHVSFFSYGFLEYVPSSGVAGLYDSLIPGFLGNLHTVLHSSCISCLCHFTPAHSPSTGNTSPVPSQPTFPHPALRAHSSGSPLWAGVPATLLCALNIITHLPPFSLAMEPVFSDPTCCRLFETDSFFFFFFR